MRSQKFDHCALVGYNEVQATWAVLGLIAVLWELHFSKKETYISYDIYWCRYLSIKYFYISVTRILW